MASTIVPVIPTITGVTCTPVTVASGDTVTVQVPPSVESIDFSKLIVQFQATTSAASSIGFVAGVNYSEVKMALPSPVTIPATGAVVTIGGKYFESARLQNSSGGLQFTNTGSSVYCTAYLLP